MVWFARSALLFPLFGLAACGGLPPSKARLALVDERLPAIFGPLTWDLSQAQAKALFPGKERNRHDILGYADRERLAMTLVWGLDWHDIGPISVAIGHDGSGRVRSLGIATSEPRDACQVEEKRPKALKCRNDYGVQLTSVLNRLKTRLARAYGKPKLFDDFPGDKRQRSYKWRRKGFDLLLAITVGEFGEWAVTLQAKRQKQKKRPAFVGPLSIVRG